MQVGEVLGDAWGIYKAHWKHLVPLALIFYAVLNLLTLVLGLALGWLGALIGALVSIVGFFWLAGALVEAVADVRDGRADLSIGETFQRVRPQLPALIPAGVLAFLGIALGLVLLIIPGLVLLTWWSLIAPVIVLEKRHAGESFSRSRELVRGHGWTVFGVLLLTFVLIAIVSSVLSGLLSALLPDWLGNYVGSVVVNGVGAPFAALAVTLMYFRLAARDQQLEATPVPA